MIDWPSCAPRERSSTIMDQPSGVANRDAVGSHKFSRMGSKIRDRVARMIFYSSRQSEGRIRERPLHAAFAPGAPPPEKVQSFVNHLAEWFCKHPL